LIAQESLRYESSDELTAERNDDSSIYTLLDMFMLPVVCCQVQQSSNLQNSQQSGRCCNKKQRHQNNFEKRE
jgi:hypothetical protein